MSEPGDGPVGIIAGGQDLPHEIVAALQAQGRSFFLFGIVGEADQRIETHPHCWLKWGEFGRLFKAVDENGIRDLLFIGSIKSRPDFKSIKLDLSTIKALPEILKVMASGGDEGVLNGVASFFEKRGLSIVSVPEVAPNLVIGPDLCVGGTLSDSLEKDIQLAANAAKMIGTLDVGQGVVVADGRIVALEGPEGTDQMLERVKHIRQEKRARWAYGKQGVLLKRARPGQDLRFDMPTIGPRTLEKAIEAGLAGIVCAQGQVLCARKNETMEKAKSGKLFLQSRLLEVFDS